MEVLADTVWDVLVEECGAHAEDRHQFVSTFDACARMEYRFIGYLGFGGKLWKQTRPRPKLLVTYYPEDKTPEREAMVERANARLALLLSE